jgi:hypothetical protein
LPNIESADEVSPYSQALESLGYSVQDIALSIDVRQRFQPGDLAWIS